MEYTHYNPLPTESLGEDFGIKDLVEEKHEVNAEGQDECNVFQVVEISGEEALASIKSPLRV